MSLSPTMIAVYQLPLAMSSFPVWHLFLDVTNLVTGIMVVCKECATGTACAKCWK